MKLHTVYLLILALVALALSACAPGESTTLDSANLATPTPFIMATAVSDSATLTALIANPTPTNTLTATPRPPTPTTTPNATETPKPQVTPSTNETLSPTLVVENSATPSTPACFGSISGTVYEDVNGNSTVDAGEAGLSGATLELKDARGTVVALYTTGNGQFVFAGVRAGEYTLRETPPQNFMTNSETLFTIKLECSATVTHNFFNRSIISPTATPTKSTASTVPNNEPGVGSIRPDAPTYFVSQCTNITVPGTYLLTASLTSKWDCVQIFSDWVLFDCQGNSLDGLDYNGYGVVVHKVGFPFSRPVQNIEIRNCKSTRHKYGIYVDAGVNIYVHHNQTIGNFTDVDERGYGQFLGLPEGGGIRANDLNNARIEDNVSTYNAIGIDIRTSTYTFVRRNVTSNNTAWGVHFYGTQNSEISFNTAKDNVRYCTWGNGTVGAGCDAGGIMLQGGSNFNTVKNNEILSGNGNGVFIKAHDQPCGNNNTIAFNHISNVLYNGIEASFCQNNRFVGNEIDHALDGVWLGFSKNTRTEGGNRLHDLNNHGYISWNSQDNVVLDNSFANDREAIYLFSSEYKKDEFFFVPGDPTDHVARGNFFGGNTLTDNATAAVHFSNAIRNEVRNNTLRNNSKNFLFDGNTAGNIIENNNITGGAYLFGVRHLGVPLYPTPPAFLRLLTNANGEWFDASRLMDALAPALTDSPDLRWFKLKMRLSFFGAP